MTTSTVLHDAPAPLWAALAAAVHKVAHDRSSSVALPSALRRYASFRPVKLLDEAPRRAIAEAVAADARFREKVGEALGKPVWSSAALEPGPALAERFGLDVAFAALAARARWDEVAAIVAASAAATPPAEEARPERPVPPRGREPDEAAVRRRIAEAEKRANEMQRRADAAERRVKSLTDEIATLRAEIDDLTGALSLTAATLEQERRRQRDRIARLRRRADEAEARTRVDARRAAEVADALEMLTEELRAALEGRTDAEVDAGGEDAGQDEDAGTPTQPSVPRTVVAARPGRPCVLPAGIHADDPAAVHALLQVPNTALVVDGYNVSKDARGKIGAQLADQRAWLETLLAGVAARYGVSVLVVWDGADDRTKAVSARRGVRVVFTKESETADERIIAMVDDREGPVVVVSSDREVREHSSDLGANVIASGVFLQAVG